MKLTEEQCKKYIRNGGNQCPFCNSDNLDGREVTIEEGEAWQPIICLDCDHEWRDVYILTYIEIDNDGEGDE